MTDTINIKLSKADIHILEEHGLDLTDINSQFYKLRKGNIPVKLIRPATLDDGIIHLSKETRNELLERFDDLIGEEKIMKFIPASGAATRMFGSLKKTLSGLRDKELTAQDLMDENDPDFRFRGFAQLVDSFKRGTLPFSDALRTVLLRDGLDPEQLLSAGDYETILGYILEDKGLGYGSCPKGLVKFHKYSDLEISPVGEHFLETALCSGNKKKNFNLHFTVPEEFLKLFEAEAIRYSDMFSKKGYRILTGFSFQKHGTDTIALDESGDPVRDSNGRIVLRAGGHGALIGNLNEIDSDIICIKNIDNLTTADRLTDTVQYKKILIAYLIDIREKIFGFMRTLPRIIKDGESINEIYCYSKDVLNISFPADFIDFDLEKKRKLLFDKLNRPIRVCGMVKNENEPGGGPFWIEGKGHETILQIVERSQTDRTSEEQKKIFSQSSYFNPVDIVCSIRDFRGKIFHLEEFVEESRYFISEKRLSGETVSILEHPGLWNGSMEKWISLFLEIPLSTFNPVKYVNDLLKENHIPAAGEWLQHLP